MGVALRSALLLQVELAYCLAALAEPEHHVRQREWLNSLRQSLPVRVATDLAGLLPKVRWQSLITWPLIPEDWPPDQTGCAVVDRLSSLAECDLVSALSGWLMDDEDVEAIRQDPSLPAEMLPQADPDVVRRLVDIVSDPYGLLTQISDVVPSLWECVWSQYPRRETQNPAIGQVPPIASDLKLCDRLLGFSKPSARRVTMGWSYFCHPHGEGICQEGELLTITSAFYDMSCACSLCLHEYLHILVRRHMDNLVREGVVESLKACGQLQSAHALNSRHLPAWEQWLEEQVVASCHNVILDRTHWQGGSYSMSGLQDRLTELLWSRDQVDARTLGELLQTAAGAVG